MAASVLDTGRRYAVVHEPSGPRIRFGVLWFGVLFVGMFFGGLPLVVVLAATAGVAALQVSGRWREAGEPVSQPVAAAGAVLIVAASFQGNRLVGLAVLAVTGAALLVGDTSDGLGALSPSGFDLWANATAVVVDAAVGLFAGLAGAAVVEVAHVDTVVVFFLVVALCVYDAGDYLCSAGYDSRVVGPMAGVLAVGVWTAAVYVFDPPVLNHAAVVWLGVLTALACPAGQLFASWLLPAPTASAAALRRLDTWLVAAPLFLVVLWIVS